MSETIRELTQDDVEQAWALSRQAFNLGQDRRERFADLFRPERTLGLFEDGHMIGKLVTHELGHWLGGRRVPMGGVAGVTVTLERRGGGVTSRLLRGELSRMRERGEVTSSLFPATVPPYRRAGWEVAGHRIRRRAPLRSLAGLPKSGPSVSIRPLDLEQELDVVRAIYDQTAQGSPGWLVRDDWWFERRAGWWLRNDQTYAYAAHDPAGDPTGYVVYHHIKGADDEFYGLEVDELVATDGDATLTLWRLLASNRGVSGRVTFHGGPEEPLFLLLPEQDTEVLGDWRWMTRLVDLPGAVEARGWPGVADAQIHLDISDDLAGWNDGRWVLTVKDGQGHLEEGGRGAVRTTIGFLAPLFTGMVTAATLAQSGLLEVASHNELQELNDVFRGPAPWMLEFF